KAVYKRVTLVNDVTTAVKMVIFIVSLLYDSHTSLVVDSIKYVLLLISFIKIHFSCDIYLFNKCPFPPYHVTVDVEFFCHEAKKHVDCVNRRLRDCKIVQEYGPALDTLKATLKVDLTRASAHGCHGLYDQIQIPRMQRRRRTTTRKIRRLTVGSIPYRKSIE
ncbi:unnamed protein product, partial [Didymodactylos carnosus]